MSLLISLKDKVAQTLGSPDLANAFRQIEIWSKQFDTPYPAPRSVNQTFYSVSNFAGTTSVTNLGSAYTFAVKSNNARILVGFNSPGSGNILTNTSGGVLVNLYCSLDGGANQTMWSYFDGQRLATPAWTEVFYTGVKAGTHSLQAKYNMFAASGNYTVQFVGFNLLIWDGTE